MKQKVMGNSGKFSKRDWLMHKTKDLVGAEELNTKWGGMLKFPMENRDLDETLLFIK